MSHSTEHLALDATTAPDAAVISTSHAPYEHDVITTPCAEPSPLLDDGAPFRPRAVWRERCVALHAQRAVMSDVLAWASSGMPPELRAHFERCVVAAEAVLASLDRIADALVATELRPGSAIVRYVDAVHGWFGAIVGELRALLVRGETAGARLSYELAALSEYSSLYLRDHLERFHRRAARDESPAVRVAQETLHGDVVWLNCELGLARE